MGDNYIIIYILTIGIGMLVVSGIWSFFSEGIPNHKWEDMLEYPKEK